VWAAPPAAPAPPPAAAPSFVDFWRAAGRGHQPAGDIGRLQENERYLHPGGR
jgi:hypothetical protein